MSEKRYPCKCAICDHQFFVTKSILQHSGYNECGHGRCPKCKTFLNLTFVPELEIMRSMEWSEYVKRRLENERKRKEGVEKDQRSD
ncbi:hypothetical protein BBF96_03415 [Anoxybacter fermentans]|uniref:Uncharacterized protein n=1 Tax=Anoxybacter fermentans TaxID=1323375 RepID=A0A3S9SW23_9FIRM|nr:hypothetical protein [Anoxybacter fermentans]AZR72513.1 hypothetical protein BBF96_03415 [Anoxybacter fermentans]